MQVIIFVAIYGQRRRVILISHKANDDDNEAAFQKQNKKEIYN